MPKSKHYDELVELINGAELFEGMKAEDVDAIKEKYEEMPDEIVLDAIEFTKKSNEEFVKAREKNGDELNKATEQMQAASKSAERFLKREEIKEKQVEAKKKDEEALKELEGNIKKL